MIMVFNSIFFIFCFLPLFLLVYYMVPARFQNPVLFAGSLIFYAWGNPVYIPLLLFSSFFNYYMGLEMERLSASPKSRKRNLVFTVVVNLLILGFFKYSGFLLDLAGSLFGFTISHPQLSLPIGISFFTFKNLSYIFDIYRISVFTPLRAVCSLVVSPPISMVIPLILLAAIPHLLQKNAYKKSRSSDSAP